MELIVILIVVGVIVFVKHKYKDKDIGYIINDIISNIVHHKTTNDAISNTNAKNGIGKLTTKQVADIYTSVGNINVKNVTSKLPKEPLEEIKDNIASVTYEIAFLKRRIERLIDLVSDTDKRIMQFLEAKEISEKVRPEIKEEIISEEKYKEIIEREKVKIKEEIPKEIKIEKMTPKDIPTYEPTEPEKPDLPPPPSPLNLFNPSH